MPEAAPSDPPAKSAKRKKKFKWRPWLRALHRDLGYLAVGLTFVYALSGLAVNHIADWDPNFSNFEREFVVEAPLPEGDEQAAAAIVLSAAGIDETPLDVYSPADGELEITLETSTLFVATETGKVYEEGQKERFALRAANWLHLNRGKKAWTWFADGYAGALILLAVSGMFMIPGRKGLVGRGAVLVIAGIAIPLAYLAYVGGP
ncbi:MAG: PepSY-associated TM helix domain-containing protein [Myxococcota bacterium]